MENPQAFPFVRDADFEYGVGMTLRDYFAAKAMAAYVADESWRLDMANEATARCAYAMADAMLKARQS